MNLEGQKLGLLEITTRDESSNKPRWNYVCACGKIGSVREDCLRRKINPQRDCGCVSRKKRRDSLITHGRSYTRTYGIWKGMLERCKDLSNIYYGAKGITVCDRWKEFENFFADMGEAPEGLTIERKDGDKEYNKENCVWTTKKAQQRNTDYNVVLTIDELSLCVSEWSEKSGIDRSIIYQRVAAGWNHRDAVFAPKHSKNPGVRK